MRAAQLPASLTDPKGSSVVCRMEQGREGREGSRYGWVALVLPTHKLASASPRPQLSSTPPSINRGWRTFKRPGVEDFIKSMAQVCARRQGIQRATAAVACVQPCMLGTLLDAVGSPLPCSINQSNAAAPDPFSRSCPPPPPAPACPRSTTSLLCTPASCPPTQTQSWTASTRSA